MAKPYALKNIRSRDDLFPVSLSEKIAGSSERKRSTKTYIPDTRLAMKLAMLGSYSERLARILVRLKNRENEARFQEAEKGYWGALRAWEAQVGSEALSDAEVPREPPEAPQRPKKLTLEAALEEFPSVEAFAQSHLHVLETLVSLKGFSLKVLARGEAVRERAREGNGSSVEWGDYGHGN